MASKPVKFEQVQKRFRRGGEEISILNGIDFSIPEGDFVGLMGPSGSGKSTLLNLIAGLDRPTSGRIRVGEFDPASMSDNQLCDWRCRNIGFVFQRYHLLDVLNAAQNVEIPLLLFSFSRAEKERRVRTALELVGLQERAQHYPRQLSGGQEQRVAIARALVADPALILADEPTGDLDARSAAEILGLLTLLNEKLGKTIIMVTHDPKASQRARRVVRLEKGVLVPGNTAVSGAA
jgi:putative ABC transport system ATP-binding protein